MSTKAIVCYASSLGGCSSVQSKEHPSSRGLFPGNHILVSGREWLQEGERKLVSKESLGKRILCSTHNNALSHVDGLAVRFRSKVDEYFRTLQIRQSAAASDDWDEDRFQLSGHDFERWAAKFAAGTLFDHKFGRWHDTASDARNPPEWILRSLFEEVPFEPPLGLYILTAVGQSFSVEYTIGHEGIYHPTTNMFLGSTINCMNMHFLIWLSKEDPRLLRVESPAGLVFGSGPGDHSLMYRVDRIQLMAGEKISAILDFDWNDKTRMKTLTIR